MLLRTFVGLSLAFAASRAWAVSGACAPSLNGDGCYPDCLYTKAGACYSDAGCMMSCTGGTGTTSTTGGVPEVPEGAIGPLTLAAASAIIYARRRWRRGRE